MSSNNESNSNRSISLKFAGELNLSPSAAYVLRHNGITSVAGLKMFLRDQWSADQISESVISELLKAIDKYDPLFVASYWNLERSEIKQKKTANKKTPLSVLWLNQKISETLEVVGITWVEDITDKFESIKKVLTFNEILEVESKIEQWNEFQNKEAVLLSISPDNDTPIEEIELQSIESVLVQKRIKSVGDLVRYYRYLCTEEVPGELLNIEKLYIIDQVYDWYTKTHSIAHHQYSRGDIIDIEPLKNYIPPPKEIKEKAYVNPPPPEKEKNELQEQKSQGVPIDTVLKSIRSRNMLKRQGIYTVEKLMTVIQTLEDIPGIGEASALEIKKALEQYSGIENTNEIVTNDTQPLNEAEVESPDKSPLNPTIADHPITVLGLTVRPFNFLKRSGYTTIGKLIDGLAELSSTKGIGAPTEDEIRSKLSAYLQLVSDDNLQKTRTDELHKLLANDINLTGLSTKTVKKLYSFDLYSIGAVVEYLRKCSVFSPLIAKLTVEVTQLLESNGFTLQEAYVYINKNPQPKRAFALRKENGTLAVSANETQYPLSENINQWFSVIEERDLRFLQQYYGLKTGKPQTLEKVAELEGCTRERVRQVKTHALTKLQKYMVLQAPDLFEPVIKQIRNRKGIVSTRQLSQDFKGELRSGHLVADKFFIFLEDFIKLLLVKPLFYCKKLDAWVIQIDNCDYSILISEKIIQCLHKSKELLWDDLFNQLILHDGLLTLDSGFALSVANCLRDLNVVNYSLNGVWSLESSKKMNRFDYIKLALTEIGNPAHFTDIAQTASEIIGKEVNPGAVNNILNTNKNVFCRIGRGTYGLIEWGFHNDGSIANAARRILFEAGKPLPSNQLIKEILTEWQVEEISITSAIDHDRRFERLSDGRVALTEFGLVDKKYKRRRDQTKKTRIYIVLKELGKPTYYKDIANKHNEKYPDQMVKIQKVYQTLMTNNDLFIRTGTATYGLREWGILEFEGKTKPSRKEQLLKAFNSANHPMDLEEMIATVENLYPDNPMTRSALSQVLTNNPELFIRLQPGVYSLNEWHQ